MNGVPDADSAGEADNGFVGRGARNVFAHGVLWVRGSHPSDKNRDVRWMGHPSSFGFEVSHPSDKNKDVGWMGNRTSPRSYRPFSVKKADEVDYAVGVAPLVVVPAENLDALADDLGERSVDDGTARSPLKSELTSRLESTPRMPLSSPSEAAVKAAFRASTVVGFSAM